MSKPLLGFIIMIIGYIPVIYMIYRAFVIGYSLSKGEVPFVPVMRKSLKVAMDLLKLEEGDRVIDIGAGGGKSLFYAVRKQKGIRLTGIEYTKSLVHMAHLQAWVLGLGKRIDFVHADAFDYDYSEFNKIYLYMTRGFITNLMPILVPQLPKGALVVSVAFGFGDEFEKKHKKDISVVKSGKGKLDQVYLWKKS